MRRYRGHAAPQWCGNRDCDKLELIAQGLAESAAGAVPEGKNHLQWELEKQFVGSTVVDREDHADDSSDVYIRTVVSYPSVFALYLQPDPGLTDASSRSGSLESTR